ncbi:GHKL domain-containing protein [Bacillus sp. BGMRC 2118]|nr:GHKL domain-containing protein [Bacillus sp. BGMRC 2118]
MKSIKGLFLYITIVILPTVILSSYFIYKELNDNQEDLIVDAERTANLYKNQLDRLIGETEAGIEMLAKVINTKSNNLNEIETILVESNKEDPRFAGFYYANEKGDLLVGSTDNRANVNVLQYNFIQTALITKKSKISPFVNDYLGEGEGKLISIVTPVSNSATTDSGLLLVNLRTDYIQNIMRVLTPNKQISVLDRNNQVIFETTQPDAIGTSYSETIMELAPWTIKVKIDKLSKVDILRTTLFYFFILFILSNAVYLLIKNQLLRKDAAFERMQNESQKLELVGQLAASTAHEIRNPLTGIKGLMKLLSEKYTEEDDQFYFSVIDEEINRINEIISEFLVLGKPTAEFLDVHDVNCIMNELHPLIQSEANLYNVQYNVTIDQTPNLIYCVKDHIKQVILNLVKNALESMSNGGLLTITAHNENNTCIISIKDTGTGIPEEVLGKIFEPFFTLKDTGTGLGLVVCQRIVSMYNGEITIKSSENIGTEVLIVFPLYESGN